MQIYELGRDTGADNKDIIRFLTENGIAVKNHMSALTEDQEKLVREAIAGHLIDAAPPVKPATTPWNDTDNPWSRDMLRLNKKHDGFRPKWAAKGEKLDRLLDIGWKIADIKDYGGTSAILGEEGQMDTTVNRREMILVEISEERAEQRTEFYAQKANKRLQDAKNMASTEANKIERATGEKVLTEHRFTQNA